MGCPDYGGIDIVSIDATETNMMMAIFWRMFFLIELVLINFK